MELKFIILRNKKLFVDMFGTFPKFPNIGINEINLQKIMEGCTFNTDVGQNNLP